MSGSWAVCTGLIASAGHGRLVADSWACWSRRHRDASASVISAQAAMAIREMFDVAYTAQENARSSKQALLVVYDKRHSAAV